MKPKLAFELGSKVSEFVKLLELELKGLEIKRIKFQPLPKELLNQFYNIKTKVKWVYGMKWN